jgi:hypothetical protein
LSAEARPWRHENLELQAFMVSEGCGVSAGEVEVGERDRVRVALNWPQSCRVAELQSCRVAELQSCKLQRTACSLVAPSPA